MCEYAPGSVAALPGGIGISLLTVYDIEAPDGLVGGAPHVHLACSEGYYVMAGSGAVQTLNPKGFSETPRGRRRRTDDPAREPHRPRDLSERDHADRRG